MAVSVSKSTTRVDPVLFDHLISSVRGSVCQPTSPDYDQKRAVHNAMHDRRPIYIVSCVDTADVVATVNFARETELRLAVRGGGHSAPGFGTVDDGVVADLSPMCGVMVDPAARLAHVGGGATWGAFNHATGAFGLATPGGIISTTGVGGLTLGGGFGYLTRQFGLSCDNVVAMQVVTAEGKVVTASANENPDLFWALRGGSGNFGVVTEFTFRLHPVSTIVGGPIFYAVDDGPQLMRFYRDTIKDAPKELSYFFGYHIAPPAPFVPEELHHKPIVGLFTCFTGPQEHADKAMRPLREAAKPLLDLTGPMPYATINTLFDDLQPPGMQQYWKADFDRTLTDDMIAIHKQFGPKTPNFQSLMHLYPMGGAVHDVERDATAFSYRDVEFTHIILGVHPERSAMPPIIDWVRAYWDALHPLSAGGAYVNFLMEEGPERIQATYREGYSRLVDAKRRWDPHNLFSVNQNILP